MGRKAVGCLGITGVVALIALAISVAISGGDDAATQCVTAPESIVADIANGLNDGMTISDAFMVRSDDRQNVTFVAARVESDGVSGVGVWATSRIDDEGNNTDTGLIYSVGNVANEVSNWGDGGRTDAELSMSEDAARQAASCVDGD